MKFFKTLPVVTAAMLASNVYAAGGSSTDPALVVTYAEAPGQETSSLQGTQVESFNNLNVGSGEKLTNVAWDSSTGAPIGTFDQLYVVPANVYGGAGGTGNYQVESNPAYGGAVGGHNAVETSTLTLNSSASYFGMWWSAGDSFNDLTFYNHGVQVGEFTTQSLMNPLPHSYYGNPSGPWKGGDSWEPFGFINFYGVNGTTFDKVVLSDSAGTGFEADNFTVRDQAWGALAGETGNVPGVQVADILTPAAAVDAPAAFGGGIGGRGAGAIPSAPELDASGMGISFGLLSALLFLASERKRKSV